MNTTPKVGDRVVATKGWATGLNGEAVNTPFFDTLWGVVEVRFEPGLKKLVGNLTAKYSFEFLEYDDSFDSWVQEVRAQAGLDQR